MTNAWNFNKHLLLGLYLKEPNAHQSIIIMGMGRHAEIHIRTRRHKYKYVISIVEAKLWVRMAGRPYVAKLELPNALY